MSDEKEKSVRAGREKGEARGCMLVLVLVQPLLVRAPWKDTPFS